MLLHQCEQVEGEMLAGCLMSSGKLEMQVSSSGKVRVGWQMSLILTIWQLKAL